MSKCDNIDTVSHLAARTSHYWGHGGHGVRVPETGARQSDNVHVGEWSLVARVTCTTADTGRVMAASGRVIGYLHLYEG